MSDATPMEKRCSKCGAIKPLDAFSKNKDGKYGCHSICKTCGRAYQQAYHAANAEAVREQKRAYNAANAEAIRERQRAYNAANAEAIREQRHVHYVANAAAISERKRAYRVANAEAIHEQKRAHYAANAAALCEQKRAHYAANINKFRQHRRTEAYLEYQRAHRAANPDLYRAKDQRRLVRKKGNGGVGFSAQELRHMRLTQGGECAYCMGLYHPHALTIDHVIPIDQGGPHEAANIVLACGICNSSKGNRTPDQWINRWYCQKSE